MSSRGKGTTQRSVRDRVQPADALGLHNTNLDNMTFPQVIMG